MPILTGRVQVVLMPETTPGTVETLESGGGLVANAVMTVADNVSWEPDIAQTGKAAMSASLGNRGSVGGARTAKIAFRANLRGRSAAFSASVLPDVTLPIRACGCSVTMSGGGGSEIVTVAPVSTISTWYTVGVYNDGLLYRIAGALGNPKFTFKNGEPVTAEFDLTGAYVAPTDVALRSSGLGLGAPVPPPFLSAALSVQGLTTARIESLSFDLGNTIALEVDPNIATGIYRAALTGRSPSGSIDPESVLVATKNYYNEWLTDAVAAITTGDFPSTGTQYNKLNLNIPKAKYTKVGRADRGGLSTAPIDFEAQENADAGDDSFSLVFK